MSEELRVWLLDKKPITLKDAGKLADEYTIIHKAYTTQKPYYRTAMRVEVTNSDKKKINILATKLSIKWNSTKPQIYPKRQKPGYNLFFM